MTLTTYGDYARLIFFLLADRATVASHTLAMSFTRPNLPFLIAEVERIIVAP